MIFGGAEFIHVFTKCTAKARQHIVDRAEGRDREARISVVVGQAHATEIGANGVEIGHEREGAALDEPTETSALQVFSPTKALVARHHAKTTPCQSSQEAKRPNGTDGNQHLGVLQGVDITCEQVVEGWVVVVGQPDGPGGPSHLQLDRGVRGKLVAGRAGGHQSLDRDLVQLTVMDEKRILAKRVDYIVEDGDHGILDGRRPQGFTGVHELQGAREVGIEHRSIEATLSEGMMEIRVVRPERDVGFGEIGPDDAEPGQPAFLRQDRELMREKEGQSPGTGAQLDHVDRLVGIDTGGPMACVECENVLDPSDDHARIAFCDIRVRRDVVRHDLVSPGAGSERLEEAALNLPRDRLREPAGLLQHPFDRHLCTLIKQPASLTH